MEPLRVVVTGAAGQIAYALVGSIAKGEVFGSEQPVTLLLLDIGPMMPALEGVVMELQDCALPLLHEIVATADVQAAFNNVDVALLVGAMPRKEGMERKDLLKANANIFQAQGKALDQFAKKTVKVLVVGNPANTNAMVCATNAPSIPKENFTALTRLDQNRAQAQVAMRLGVACNAVKKTIIWGNHSSTQYPDTCHALVSLNGEEVPVPAAVKDDDWLRGDFIKTVQSRGGAIIKARKLSSAMSAAKAICDHMRDWWFGTEFTSMGVWSTGSCYGIPEGIIYSFPLCIRADKSWEVVQGLPVDDFSREKMDLTAKELIEEKEASLEFISS